MLDPVQRQVAHADQHTLLLGPAGTGRTCALQWATTLLARAHGSHRVVAVTADRTAARQWQGVIARRLTGAAPVITTVAGLAQQVLTSSDRLGRPADHRGEWSLDAADPFERDLRTLTAPEQEVRIREILDGTVSSGSVDWPAEWKPALGTRTFARELRRAVAHARRWGWEPEVLCREARASGDPGWYAVGQFLAEYLQVLDWEGALDYSELALRALRRCESRSPDGDPLFLVVDDAHHLDPTQAQLLTAVAGAGGFVVSGGDPDQCVASYKGADLSALAGFAEFSRVLVADTLHRGGAHQRDARRELLGRRWYVGLPVAPGSDYRTPAVTAAGDHVEAVEYDDPLSQAHHIAQLLWTQHRAGTDWRDMAVLVTSPNAELSVVARVLGQARIPVHVPTADRALAELPAVATLLAAARLVLSVDPTSADHDPVWTSLLSSDLGAVGSRRLRELRRAVAKVTPPEDAELTWGQIARDPVLHDSLPSDLREVARVLAMVDRRITAARRLQARDATPAEVLWQIWHGGDDSWPQRLRRRALSGGEAAIAANRDLDAVIQVFRLAERAPERWGGHRGLSSLIDELEHQEIPAEPDLKQESLTDSVAVLSLHRALGRTWPVVVVTGLQESNWRGGDGQDGLIQPTRLGPDRLLPDVPRRAAAQRRRLLNVALARASRTLLLAACGGPEDPPTPLLGDAGLPVRRVRGLPPTPQTPVDLMVQARREALTDANRAPAVAALARLTTARTPTGRPLFPGMAPARWEGASDWTVGPTPLRPDDRALSLSGSALALLDQCQLRWLLQRELKADRPQGPHAGFGLVVHAAAAALAGGDERQPDEILEEVWREISYDAGWQEAAERTIALTAIQRAANWLQTRPVPVAAEERIAATLPVVDSAGQPTDEIAVSGSIDVVERHDDHVLVWDYKTQRSAVSGEAAATNVQLAVYQLAIAQALGLPARGAGLVQVCVPAGAADPLQPKIRTQSPVGELADLTDTVLRRAAVALRTEQFEATKGPACRTCPFVTSCPAHAREGDR
jgi:superfamily I DNA/RNA helicase